MAESDVENVVEEKANADDQSIGIFKAVALIFAAIAQNIASGGLTEMTNMFRMFFRSFLATVLVLGGGYFMFKVALTFETDESQLNEYVGVIIGFVAGFLTAAIGFYFGGQDRSKKKETEEVEE